MNDRGGTVSRQRANETPVDSLAAVQIASEHYGSPKLTARSAKIRAASGEPAK